jgi:hypothetical protein
VGARSLTLLVLVAAAAIGVSAGGSELLAKIPSVTDTATEVGSRAGIDDQGAAQISPAEFLQVKRGVTRDELRALVGKPEDSDSSKVEGVRLDCWYYGVVGATGAFQFCFADDRLVSRFRFDG